MDQEKRLLLAFALSFALIVAWSVIFRKVPPPRPPGPTKPRAAPAVAQPEAPPPRTVALAVEQGSKAEEIVVEKGNYRITFSTQGAVITSWVLKGYGDEQNKPLDVVNRLACANLGFPMGLTLADAALADKLNSTIYVAKTAGGPPGSPDRLEFSYSDGHILVRKIFGFSHPYEIQVETTVFDGARNLPVQVNWRGGFGDYSLPPKSAEGRMFAVYGAPENLTTVAFSKVKEEQRVAPGFELAGLEDRYFVDIFFPDDPGAEFRLRRQDWKPPEKDGQPMGVANPLEASLASPGGKPLGFRLFVAPKDLDVLRRASPPLDRLVDFGWFSFVAKPLFLMLRYVYERWAHNWGWAIIILTVLLNFALFPLKLKSLKSAQEMQKIAPIVKEIQERYKQYKFNDPRKQRMNQEIMKLYKEHGVNPLGGCLPMALQLPLLYGFWRVLDLAIELRHAPWIGCVRDLSAPDRCYLFGIHLALLPTIMIVTMFFMQKMTPMATADPAQQRMMMIMPLFFGAFFYGLASGLVLYYLTANVVGIGQQLFINKFFPSAAPPPKGPPSARAPQAPPKGAPSARAKPQSGKTVSAS